MRKLWTLCLLTLALVGCGPSAAPDNPDIGKVGDILYLTGGKTHVPVTSNDAFDERLVSMQNLPQSDDVRNGNVLLVPNGTEVKVIDVIKGDRNFRKVHVNEGQYKGKEGCVSYKWLTAEKPAPTP